MRRAHLILLCCLLTAGAVARDDLSGPFRLKSAGKVIDVNTGHAAPFLFDYDADGVRDLLVGEFGSGSMRFEGEAYARGRLRIYRNVGTEKKPRYDGFEWFKAGGKIAEVPITCCVSFCPEVVDWEADGDMDLLTGSYPGHLYLYRNDGKGEYAAAEMLRNTSGEPVNSGSSSNPRARDWDGDGDLDLVIANSSYIHVVRNTGTRKAPQLSPVMAKVEFRGKGIRLRGRLGVEMADWNGDGRDDLLIGESAGVVVLFDSARRGDPVFKKSRVLIRDRSEDEAAGRVGTDYPGGRLKLHVADFDGDGISDLLVGDVNSPDTTRPRADLTTAERKAYETFKKRTGPATREIDRLVTDRDLLLDRAAAGKLQRRIFDLLDERGDDYYDTCEKYEETTSGGTHGHVWVYLRKKSARTAFQSLPASGKSQLRVRLGAESRTVQPGRPFRLGLLFEVADGWHTYSGREGAAKQPTSLDLQLPAGFEVRGTQWPEPTDAATGSHDDDFIVTLTIAPPDTLPQKQYAIRVSSGWVACKDRVCTRGESYNRIELKTGARSPTPVADWLHE